MIYLGLGANLGDARARLDWAAGRLRELGLVRVSSYRVTRPQGPVPDQPWFTNAVAELRTDLEPLLLLDHLLGIERLAGRDRAREIPQGPRALDLDLLLHGDTVLDHPRLTLPHPRLHLREFVVIPLLELAGPDLEVPGRGRLGDLAERLV